MNAQADVGTQSSVATRVASQFVGLLSGQAERTPGLDPTNEPMRECSEGEDGTRVESILASAQSASLKARLDATIALDQDAVMLADGGRMTRAEAERKLAQKEESSVFLPLRNAIEQAAGRSLALLDEGERIYGGVLRGAGLSAGRELIDPAAAHGAAARFLRATAGLASLGIEVLGGGDMQSGEEGLRLLDHPDEEGSYSDAAALALGRAARDAAQRRLSRDLVRIRAPQLLAGHVITAIPGTVRLCSAPTRRSERFLHMAEGSAVAVVAALFPDAALRPDVAFQDSPLQDPVFRDAARSDSLSRDGSPPFPVPAPLLVRAEPAEDAAASANPTATAQFSLDDAARVTGRAVALGLLAPVPRGAVLAESKATARKNARNARILFLLHRRLEAALTLCLLESEQELAKTGPEKEAQWPGPNGSAAMVERLRAALAESFGMPLNPSSAFLRWKLAPPWPGPCSLRGRIRSLGYAALGGQLAVAIATQLRDRYDEAFPLLGGSYDLLADAGPALAAGAIDLPSLFDLPALDSDEAVENLWKDWLTEYL